MMRTIMGLTAHARQNKHCRADATGLANPNARRPETGTSHGVEGFAGSAIQLRILDDPPQLLDEETLVLVHVLNPYGMAWLRRGGAAMPSI